MHLSSDVGEFFLEHFRGDDAVIMRGVRSKCKNLIVTKNGNRAPCVALDKVQSGCAQSTLLWHKLSVEILDIKGFALNHCDLCAVRIKLGGSQCDVAQRVDSDKTSHKSIKVAQDPASKLESRLGEIHSIFLEMKLAFNDKKASVDARECLGKLVADFGVEGLEDAPAPTKSNTDAISL